MVSLACHFLYRLPYLLYLADTQLGLVKEEEMFVEVGVIVKHKASCIEFWVTSCASSFLHVVLKGVGDVIVNHKSHIFLVNTHSKR